jgi:hypothetical protein
LAVGGGHGQLDRHSGAAGGGGQLWQVGEVRLWGTLGWVIAAQYPQQLAHLDIGTIDPARAVPAEEAYLSAFFDRWLRGHDNHLLDGPSPRYPEFTFVR